ncbi:MAG: acetyl-CoA carboxylase biotin carboxyl carrier protein, partial [Bacteroidota bacterium]
MDVQQIQELLRIVAESGVAEVEIEQDGFKLTVRKSGATVNVQSTPPPAYPFPFPTGYPPAPMPVVPQQVVPPAVAPPPVAPAAPQPVAPQPAAATPAPAPAAAKGETVKAPIVGTFYSAPSPDDPAFVEVGTQVKVGDVLCIIEAMKLMNEIECEVAGTVTEILVQNAEPVEYDQP